MKPRITINGIVLLLLFLIFSSAKAQVSVTDGGFEAWTISAPSGLQNWSFNGAYSETPSFDALGGSYALSLASTGNYPALTVDYLFQGIGTEDVTGGYNVTVTVWAKGSGNIAVGIHDGTSFVGGGVQITSVNPFYFPKAFTFNTATTASAAHEVRIQADVGVVIDNFSVSPAAGNLTDVTNGDFETWTSGGTATLDNWSLNNFTSADVDPTTPNSGTYAVSIAAGDLTSGTGSYLYQSLGTPSGNREVKVDFYAQSAGPNGIQVGVDNGTSLVYSDEFTLTTSFAQYSFTFDAASGTSYEIRFAGGVGTTVHLDDVTVTENDPPTATALSITGTFETGYTLTANYTYGDTEADAEGTTQFQWYTATTSTGTVGKTAISGANSSTYTLTAAENGFHIGFEVTPVAQTGSSPGATAEVGTYGGPVVANAEPFLSPATVTLTLASGTTVKQDATYDGSFTINDAEGNDVGYDWQWYKSDDASGTNKTAATGTGNSGSVAPATLGLPVAINNVATYTVDFTDIGKYLTLEITPTAGQGPTPGTTVSSTAIGPIVGYVVEIPTLTAPPANGATGIVLNPTLSWTLPIAGGGSFDFPPTDYEVEVATDAFFANIVHSEIVVHPTQTTGALTTTLSVNTTYYWRVRSRLTSTTPVTYSPWSMIWSFTTTAVTAPVISYPTGGATVYTADPTVYWYTTSWGAGITYTLDVATDAGFTSPIAGSPFSAGSNLFYALSGLTPGATYHIRVNATDGTVTETSAAESFVVDNSAGGLVVPIPSYPISGVTVYSATPTLYWYLGSYSSGLTYHVQVTTIAGNYGAPVYDVSGISNLYTTTGTLTAGTTYYWRVRSFNGAYSAWSTEESFTVFSSGAGAIPLPVLSWPVGGATVYTTSPSLHWYLSSYASGLTFEWEVYDDAGYTSLVTSGTTATYSAIASGLSEGTTYYWQVRTEQSGAYSAWVQDNFVTFTSATGGGGVPTPVLSYPIGGAPAGTTDPTLYWYILGSTTGITYDLNLSKYPGMVPAEGGYPLTGISAQSYALSGLDNGTTYYWTVRSYDGSTYSPWASSESFYTPVVALSTAVPTPGSPIGGVIPETSTPELSWFVQGDDSELTYNVEYSKTLDFADAEKIDDIDARSVIISDLDGGEKYYWRVSSKSVQGQLSDYSPIVSFVAPNVTGVAETGIVPDVFTLEQNYPNPFNPSTNIRYSLPEAAFVTLKVYNTLGQEVKTLINRQRNAGVYNVTWNGTDNFGNKVSTGTYIYRFVAGENIITKKMVLLK